MAAIREYTVTPEQADVHATDLGAQAFAEAAYHEQRLIRQAGEEVGSGLNNFGNAIEKHDTMQEISQGTASYAQMMDTLTQNWNETAKNIKDPNDAETVTNKWRQSVMLPTIQKWRDQFSTPGAQQWALGQSDTLVQHLFQKTAADRATFAGDAIQTNLDTMGNALTNTVGRDPSSLPAAHEAVDTMVEALIQACHTCTADQTSKMRTELTEKMHDQVAVSAVLGAANKNPNAARTLLDSSDVTTYVGEQRRSELGKYIDEQERASVETQLRNQAEARRQQEEMNDSQISQLMASTIDPKDGSTHLPPNYFQSAAKMAYMPGMKPGLVESMMAFGHRVVEEQAKGLPAITNPQTYSSFVTRMNAAPSTPQALSLTDIFNARASGQLSDKDFAFFRQWVESDSKNPAKVDQQRDLNMFFNGTKRAITQSNPMMNVINAGQDFMYMQYQQTMTQRYWDGIAAGKKPLQLTSPSSPDYIAKDIHRWQLTSDQAQHVMEEQFNNPNMTQGQAPIVQPTEGNKWQKGESMDDYYKRLKGGQ